MECPDEFTEFAATEMLRLRRTAYLLCGDWHAAEDLTQIALTKTLLAWRRISRQENAHAYAHRTLVNAYLSQRRTRKSGEIPVGSVPDHAGQPGTAELRVVLMNALAALPPQARAVIVLRYWEDQSIDQVAAILRCSGGSVKSQSARALRKLRDALGHSLPEAAGSRPSKGMPLTIGQLLKIVLDGRWQFTISQSFVQQASPLHIVPINTSGN